MKTLKKNIAFAALAAALIMVIFFCFSQSVYSQGRQRLCTAEKESMDDLEREYMEWVAGIMKEYGCEYSGITMTKVFEADGSRSYQVLIHHRNLSFLSKEEREELKERLMKLSGSFQDAEFTYGFSGLS